MREKVVKRFVSVTGDVSRKSDVSAWRARRMKRAQEVRLDEPAFLLLLFWPRIREQDEAACKAVGSEPGQNISCIVHVEAYICQPKLIYPGESFGHALYEGLAANKADIWIGARLSDQVLAATEADLKPDWSWCFEQRLRIEFARTRRRYGECWEYVVY